MLLHEKEMAGVLQGLCEVRDTQGALMKCLFVSPAPSLPGSTLEAPEG